MNFKLIGDWSEVQPSYFVSSKSDRIEREIYIIVNMHLPCLLYICTSIAIRLQPTYIRIERLQCHPGKSGGHVFWCLQSVTECFQSVTDYLQPVTELGTPKNMATALPGIALVLQPLCTFWY